LLPWNLCSQVGLRELLISAVNITFASAVNINTCKGYRDYGVMGCDAVYFDTYFGRWVTVTKLHYR
jgi:hypothetical protein